MQDVDSLYDVVWARDPDTGAEVTYGEVRLEEELQFSVYNFEDADVPKLWEHFRLYEAEAQGAAGECERVLAEEKASAVEKRRFPLLPTYELALKCSNLFNLLDARGAISVTERVGVIARIRNSGGRRGQGLCGTTRGVAQLAGLVALCACSRS